ncbi:MAG: response regulator [Candidatus Methylacidiphilales bacterium]
MKTERWVLLADDDENDILFLQRAFKLAEIGQMLRVVNDGQAVIEYLLGSGNFADRKEHPLPDLLILDLKMPRKTGLEVLDWLRHHGPMRTLPVIMLSSSVYPSDIQKAYQLGTNAYITKPSGTAQRNELVKLIKGFWLGFNEVPQIS